MRLDEQLVAADVMWTCPLVATAAAGALGLPAPAAVTLVQVASVQAILLDNRWDIQQQCWKPSRLMHLRCCAESNIRIRTHTHP